MKYLNSSDSTKLISINRMGVSVAPNSVVELTVLDVRFTGGNMRYMTPVSEDAVVAKEKPVVEEKPVVKKVVKKAVKKAVKSKKGSK